MSSLMRRTSPTDLSFLMPARSWLSPESPIRLVPDASSVAEVVRTLAYTHLEETRTHDYTTRYLAELRTYTERTIKLHELDTALAITRDNNWTQRYIVDRQEQTTVELARLRYGHLERMAEEDRRESARAQRMDVLRDITMKVMDKTRRSFDVAVEEGEYGWFNRHSETRISIRYRRR